MNHVPKILAPLIDAPAIHVHIARMVWSGPLLYDNFSIQFAGGQWSCLLGASGVGKSSLLRLLAGLTAGAETSVTASDGLPLAGRVAYMAQNDLLLPWCDARANVLWGMRLRRPVWRARPTPAQRERAEALLCSVGLGDALHKYPAQLSGGMRQRVALARTLMEDRPVIAMDEPFSALDAVTRHRLQELSAAHFAGRTVIMVTHDPAEALRLSHRVQLLAGRPVQARAFDAPSCPPPRERADFVAEERALWQALAAEMPE